MPQVLTLEQRRIASELNCYLGSMGCIDPGEHLLLQPKGDGMLAGLDVACDGQHFVARVFIGPLASVLEIRRRFREAAESIEDMIRASWARDSAE